MCVFSFPSPSPKNPMYSINLRIDFFGHRQKTFFSTCLAVSLKRRVSIVSFPNKNQRERLVSVCISLLLAVQSQQGQQHYEKATQRRTKWMAVIILQCSLSLSDRPHPLHLHLSTFPLISTLSICTLSSYVSSLPNCFFFSPNLLFPL